MQETSADPIQNPRQLCSSPCSNRHHHERQKLAAQLEELESNQLSVEDVAYELGFDPLGSDRSPDWKRDKEVIQIVENAWMKPEGKHGSTLELVMERGGYSFNETVGWLATRC